MSLLLQDSQLQQVLQPAKASSDWQAELEKVAAGELVFNRQTADGDAIRAFQRLLIFLGYLTSTTGSFLVDGDFGRGTNRGLAQFMLDHDLAPAGITRETLAYPCTWKTARKLIKSIPEVELNDTLLEAILEAAKAAIESNRVNCGSFDEAIYQLNALDTRLYLSCRMIYDRYGAYAEEAAQTLKETKGIRIQPEWILSIIRQATAGVVSPRFEQHWFSKLAKNNPEVDLVELRFRSMSFGLGQIMGFNYKRVGAESAQELFTFPMEKQITSIARFLTLSRRVKPALSKRSPTADDFKAVARYYAGPNA